MWVFKPSGVNQMSQSSEDIIFLPEITDSDIYTTLEASGGVLPFEPVLHKERVHSAGWLWKAFGTGPLQTWKRQWVRQCRNNMTAYHFRIQHTMGEPCLFGAQFYLLDDRLCYTHTPSTSQIVRYLPLDRIPVRPLPRHYGPRIGVSKVSSSQVLRRSQGSVFAVHCGRHTHFMAAESAALATVSQHRCTSAFKSLFTLHNQHAAAVTPGTLKVIVFTGLGEENHRGVGTCCQAC